MLGSIPMLLEAAALYGIYSVFCWLAVMEKDARNFLERTPYQYINIRRDWSEKGVNGEGGSDEATVLRSSDTLLGEVQEIWH